ncbi:MAG: ABC transporter substrate-binding protein [Chloroflexota bacterium]
MNIKRTLLALLLTFALSIAVAAQDVTTVTIGVLITDEDLNPAQAEVMRNAVDLAVDEVNDDGGIKADNGNIYRLRVQYEAVGNSADVNQAIASLQADGVVAILGLDSNALLPADLAINVPLLMTASGIDGAYTNLSDNLFQLRANDTTLGRMAVEFAMSELDAEEIGLVAIDSLYANATAEAVIEAINDVDDDSVELTVNESHALDTSDMSDIVATISEENPDAVIVADTLSNTQILLDALAESDWDGDVVYAYGDDNLLTINEGELDFYALRLWSDIVDDTISEDFVDLYETTYGTSPTETSALYYDGLNLLVAGLADVGNSAADLQTWLTNTADYTGVQGIYSDANEFGELIRMAVVVQLDEGELTEEQRYTVDALDDAIEEMSEADDATS